MESSIFEHHIQLEGIKTARLLLFLSATSFEGEAGSDGDELLTFRSTRCYE